MSGGRDSTALLHATLRTARLLGVEVHALHVHHGLMAAADDWLAHLSRQCRRWRVPLLAERIAGAPSAGESVEAWARRERYAALRRMALQAGAPLVLLAHHRRDQAETVLLQALRGAGPAGLSAMPRVIVREGLTWARPWLQVPREHIEAYVRRWRLGHVDDPSNADDQFARARWRALWPALEQHFPPLETALGRVAKRAQRAQAALDELAQQDFEACREAGGGLTLAALRTLSAARADNLLRHWLGVRLGRGAPDDLVDRLLSELNRKGPERPARWPAPGADVCLYRGVLGVAPRAAAPSGTWDGVRHGAWRVALDQPGSHRIGAWQGCLVVEACTSQGIAASLLKDCELRPRAGGERFQESVRGTARALKKQFQRRGIPAWARTAPLLFAGDRLLFVPGLGIDARCLAPPGVPQLSLRWEPDAGKPG